MRRVYPRVDYTPAPWTVVGTVDRCYAWAAELKHPHFKGGIDVSPAVPLSICLFVGSSPCWRHSRSGIIICNKSYITTDKIGVPSKLHVAHTHTRAVTELFKYEVLLYSSLYLFEYCFYLNSGTTVHPDIVHRNR